jgi:replicative DNA helicase
MAPQRVRLNIETPMPEPTPPAPDPAPPDLKKTPRQKAPAASLRLDRLPPHSLEAERGVLGCMLLAPRENTGRCIERFKHGAQVFYEPRHQAIFAAIAEMYDAQAAIDVVTVGQYLRDQNRLESAGGFAHLSSLLESAPSAASLEYYADIVRAKFVLRRMIQTCSSVITRAYTEQDDVDALLDEVERDILQVSEDRIEPPSRQIKELVSSAIATIEDYFHRRGALTGLATGFTDLDRMTSGLHGGDMIVLAARPSMGKTSLAMNIAEHVAIELQQPVGVFSLEMTAEALVMRLLCSLSRVNLRSIREGFMSERDFPKLITATGRLSSAPLFIDDTPGLSILQARARARRMWQQSGIKLFVVDYLQLLHSTARRSDQNRQQEIADISSGIKSLAKELNVPIIVLSQLNREVERDKSRKPKLSDLRESGAIEQDADLVGLLYKADPANPRKAAPADDDDDDAAVADAIPVNLLIAKQRNGPTGDVSLTFLRSFTRFETAAKIPEDVPAP